MNPFKPDLFDGKNSLDSFEMYLSRAFYRQFALSEDGSIKIKSDETKDLYFAEKALHGKINDFGKTIEPVTGHMEYIAGSEVPALNFVVAAFLELQNAIRSAARSGNLSPTDSHLNDFKPFSGFIDYRAAYNVYLETFQKFFLTYLEGLSNEKKKRLDDFQAFTDLFLDFFNFFSKSFPFTRTGFTLSNLVSNQCSGLIISISSGDFSSDEEKIKNFYNSQNFDFYKKAAISHGFLIDKNAPWRLIADIDNPIMQNYINTAMGRETFQRKKFFNYFFTPTASQEISEMKDFMANIYNVAIQKNKIDRTITLNSKDCFEITSKRRQLKSPGEIFKSLNQEEWIYIYLKIKNLETQIDYSEDSLRAMAKNAKDLIKKVDISSAMSYINDRFTAIPFSEGSLNYGSTKLTLRETGENLDSSMTEKIKKKTRMNKRTLY